MGKWKLGIWVLVLASLVAPAGAATAQGATPEGRTEVILATTTSTQDSGLLDELVPMFEEATGYQIKPIAVGSGAAMQMGERGEADVLLVHSPADEEAFMASGYGTERRMVFYNDFVIVGPESDPAGVRDAASAVEAMQRIAQSESVFVSRGDDSGTHKLELKLWELAEIQPSGGWYVESGTSMGETLLLSSEREAYTIADRGTLLAVSDSIDSAIVREGDPELLNVYHVITVNPERYDTINAAGAQAFLEFLLDPTTQEFVGQFGVEEFGRALFVPCADGACDAFRSGTPEAA